LTALTKASDRANRFMYFNPADMELKMRLAGHDAAAKRGWLVNYQQSMSRSRVRAGGDPYPDSLIYGRPNS
jgi:hypothetical protein